jgi:hypothetical protein
VERLEECCTRAAKAGSKKELEACGKIFGAVFVYTATGFDGICSWWSR